MEEIFKPVVGFEGYYEISNMGKLARILKNGKRRVLNPPANGYGYYRSCLCVNSKVTAKLIHRMVAEAFISNPHNKEAVNHKDFNKTNNCADNLEWVTRAENTAYNYDMGHVSREATRKVGYANARKVINILTGEIYESRKALARKLGKTDRWGAHYLAPSGKGKTHSIYRYIEKKSAANYYRVPKKKTKKKQFTDVLQLELNID